MIKRSILTVVLQLILLSSLMCGCMENSSELTDEASRLINIKYKYDEGKELLEQAIEMDPDNARAHKNLAFVLLREKKPKEALAHLKKAVEADPDYGEAHINLSLIAYTEKDYPTAVEHMDKAIECGFPVDLRYRNTLQEHR